MITPNNRPPWGLLWIAVALAAFFAAAWLIVDRTVPEPARPPVLVTPHPAPWPSGGAR